MTFGVFYFCSTKINIVSLLKMLNLVPVHRCVLNLINSIV